MKRKTLQRGDGTPQKRPWLRSEVRRMQRSLKVAGHNLDADGFFGKGTEEEVKTFQTKVNAPANGIVDPHTWTFLAEHLLKVTEHTDRIIGNIMSDFNGDLEFIHLLEGHKGRPYWPGGQSGVTLDPGVDLGFADEEIVRGQYGSLLTDTQWRAAKKVFGINGQAARDAIDADPVLKGIRISRDAADEIMPFVAKKYWVEIKTRFPSIIGDGVPPAIHTAMLSLAYNRGASNKGLGILAQPLASGDWAKAGELVHAMQQDHDLRGIRLRRQWEGSLILSDLES